MTYRSILFSPHHFVLHLSDLAHCSVSPKISFSCHFWDYIIVSGFPQFFFYVSSLMGCRNTLFPFLFLASLFGFQFILISFSPNIPIWIRYVVCNSIFFLFFYMFRLFKERNRVILLTWICHGQGDSTNQKYKTKEVQQPRLDPEKKYLRQQL